MRYRAAVAIQIRNRASRDLYTSFIGRVVPPFAAVRILGAVDINTPVAVLNLLQLRFKLPIDTLFICLYKGADRCQAAAIFV